YFLQADDGIRDSSVTGVQTCALPIWCRRTCRTEGGEMIELILIEQRLIMGRDHLTALRSTGSSAPAWLPACGRPCRHRTASPAPVGKAYGREPCITPGGPRYVRIEGR